MIFLFKWKTWLWFNEFRWTYTPCNRLWRLTVYSRVTTSLVICFLLLSPFFVLGLAIGIDWTMSTTRIYSNLKFVSKNQKKKKWFWKKNFLFIRKNKRSKINSNEIDFDLNLSTDFRSELKHRHWREKRKWVFNEEFPRDVSPSMNWRSNQIGILFRRNADVRRWTTNLSFVFAF